MKENILQDFCFQELQDGTGIDSMLVHHIGTCSNISFSQNFSYSYDYTIKGAIDEK